MSFPKGHHHTAKAKAKISTALKGKRPYEMTENIRTNMSASHKGHHLSARAKKNLQIGLRKLHGTWDGVLYKNGHDKHLRRTYGVADDEYKAMLRAQRHRCAICKSQTPNRLGSKRFAIDHDHKTGKVRGLLCHKCNTALGLVGDDIETLENMMKYLKEKQNDSRKSF